MGTPIRTILDDLDKSELENQINASISNLQTQIDDVVISIPTKGRRLLDPYRPGEHRPAGDCRAGYACFW